MAFENRRPQDLADRVSRRRTARGHAPAGEDLPAGEAWRRESFTLPRVEARNKAREWFDRYPKAAYLTEIEFWRVLEDDRIEFTMRRLPSAD